MYNNNKRYQENVHNGIASVDEFSFRQSLNSENCYSVDSQYIVSEDIPSHSLYGRRNPIETMQINIPHLRNRSVPLATRYFHSYSSRGI